MQEIKYLAEAISIIKALGLPAIIFIIWWFDHRKITALLATIQKDASFIKEAKELIAMMIRSQVRIEQKIDTNHFCPEVRKAEGIPK